MGQELKEIDHRLEFPVTAISSLTSLYQYQKMLEDVLDQKVKKHNEEIKTINAERLRVRTLITQHAAGLDTEKISRAEKILEIRGDYNKAGRDRASVIKDAITWFIEGKVCYENGDTNYYKDMTRYYYGTKNYDCWHGQRSDHEYCFGPRHGSICFSIGLAPSYRGPNKSANFVNDDREAVLYYLTNISAIHEAREKSLPFST